MRLILTLLVVCLFSPALYAAVPSVVSITALSPSPHRLHCDDAVKPCATSGGQQSRHDADKACETGQHACCFVATVLEPRITLPVPAVVSVPVSIAKYTLVGHAPDTAFKPPRVFS